MPAKRQPGKASARLDPYRKKRDFTATPEPSGKAGRGGKEPVFVIQEHHARSHHFDLRLEMHGVLASWAVPKGIPEETGSNRLAVQVEDHPLDYAAFEGEIPAGHYGAGHVAIWDRGTWTPLERDWKKSFAKGKLKFRFHGTRLDGPYLLARMADGEKNWLLRKLNPDTHPDPTPAKASKGTAEFISPQLARHVAATPAGDAWVQELKYDGYRIIAVRRSGKVRLFTRKGLDWTEKFGPLPERIRKLPGGDLVLDGEVVVFDKRGHSDFGALQVALKSGDDGRMRFVVFDLLHLDGKDLRPLPLADRLKHLATVVTEEAGESGKPVVRSRIWPGDAGEELFRQSCKLGLEGIISKRLGGKYLAGERKDWVKSKCRPRQEFVICGYTAPKGACPAFGALMLASMERGRVVPRGKVGTGFSDAARRSLLTRMKALATRRAAFPSSEADVTWIKPELVAEIEFAGLTRDGAIRQGSFVGLREDKPAREVSMSPAEAAAGQGDEVSGITISSPDRVIYPEVGITKLELARYFERMAEWMLPHVAGRPLALLRLPEGLNGGRFFQKSFKTHVPDHVRTKTLDDGTEILFIRDTAGLVSLAQHGVIELHPWGAAVDRPDRPDVLVWDLDPDEAVPWKETLGAAFLLRDLLHEHGLEPKVKTSGGKGLHVVLHIRRQHGWDVVKPFTKAVAAKVAKMNPSRFTLRSSLKARTGKIYIDWLRNGRGATCIAPWCPRARDTATVSVPLNWDDLGSAPPEGFTMHDPLHLPSEWESIEPVTLPVAVIRHFTA